MRINILKNEILRYYVSGAIERLSAPCRIRPQIKEARSLGSLCSHTLYNVHICSDMLIVICSFVEK